MSVSATMSAAFVSDSVTISAFDAGTSMSAGRTICKQGKVLSNDKPAVSGNPVPISHTDSLVSSSACKSCRDAAPGASTAANGATLAG